MLRKKYHDMVIDVMQQSTWMPAVRHPLHQDDIPDDINAVIIVHMLGRMSAGLAAA